jgi:sugar/nucleoside kinase (ribokinase family)
MIDLLAVGDVMLDVLGPAGAREPVHGPVVVRAGGAAVNAARVAVALGARAAVFGRIGDDAAGRAILDELQRAGVESLLEVDTEAATGTAVRLGDQVVADRGANARFAASGLPDARVTLVSGYLPHAAVASVLARAPGLRALDTQGVCAGPYDEVEVLLGPGLDLDAHPGLIVCATRGADGALAAAHGEHASYVPPRRLDRSPVGAGDAFAAGFLLALADGVSLAACLARAGLAVEHA